MKSTYKIPGWSKVAAAEAGKMEGRGGAAWLGTWISLFGCAAWMTLVTGNQLHFLYIWNGNGTKTIQHSEDKF